MKRVAILWDYYQHYHHARLRALEVAGLAQDCVVYGLAAGESGAARDSHVALAAGDGVAPEVLDGAEGTVDSPCTARQFVEWLDVQQPDVAILPGYANRVARAGLRWCRRNRKGAVLMFETQERDLPRRWHKEFVKCRLVGMGDAVFGGGRTHLDYAHKLGMPAERCFDGYDVVDNAFWQERAAAARAGSPNSHEPYFFAVGRFIPKKNFDGLVRAFADFRRQAGHEEWRLVIGGDGPERARIEADITTAGLSETVVLPGYLDPEATARWLGRAAAFVMPSSREEQWGLVVNEAMAAGTPVIVSEICGCALDLVSEGETGLLFSPSRPDSLVAALTRLAASPDLRAKLAAGAAQRIGHYSVERFASQALAAAAAAFAHAQRRRWAPWWLLG